MILVLFIFFLKNRRLLQANEADKWSSYEDGEKHATNKEKTSAVQRNGSFCGETGFSATVLMRGKRVATTNQHLTIK